MPFLQKVAYQGLNIFYAKRKVFIFGHLCAALDKFGNKNGQ